MAERRVMNGEQQRPVRMRNGERGMRNERQRRDPFECGIRNAEWGTNGHGNGETRSAALRTTPWTSRRGKIALDTRAVMGVPGIPRKTATWSPCGMTMPPASEKSLVRGRHRDRLVEKARWFALVAGKRLLGRPRLGATVS